ncbi:MAG: chemotaxis protein CheX [Fibrobacteria bacterium]|nr:chemotaxis protein CheX [Fibrobacteria bacterium]
MSDSLLTTAAEVFPRMLEDSAFLFAEDPEGAIDFRTPVTGVAIAYEGPEHGVLHLWAQDAFMRSLAANMLGIDETDEGALNRRFDALGELLNIVLGHCLTERFGESETMKMGLPHRLDLAELEADKLSGIWLSVEGEPVLLAWSDPS